MTKIRLMHRDNMDFMASIPDKFYELAIVDPPYGIGEDGERSDRNRPTEKWRKPKPKIYTKKNWDNNPPSKDYFIELKRVSKNQIIWGANHFIENVPFANSSSWIVWDKVNGDNDFADCELAYTSFNKAVRKFEWLWNGFQKQKPEERFHPTQKPIDLYKFCLSKFATKGDKILDTHGGSMSIAIACADYSFDLDLCELDADYYRDGVNRVKNHLKQSKMFGEQIELILT